MNAIVNLPLDRSEVLHVLRSLQLYKRTRNQDTLHGCTAQVISLRLVRLLDLSDPAYAEVLRAWLEGREPAALLSLGRLAEHAAGTVLTGSGV